MQIEYRDEVDGKCSMPVEFFDEHSRDAFRTVLAKVFSQQETGSKWNRGHHWVHVEEKSHKENVRVHHEIRIFENSQQNHQNS